LFSCSLPWLLPFLLPGVAPQLRRMRCTLLSWLSGTALAGNTLPLYDGSALEAARALKPPEVLATTKGELEGYDFWDEHDDLLTRAWRELGPRNANLYTYSSVFEQQYIAPEMRGAVGKARAGNEFPAMKLFEEIVPGVFATTRLFTDKFMQDLLDEIDHIQNSGVPRRRPNGMNRYGIILDQVGLEAAITGLVQAYVRPLAQMLFPELVGPTDADEHYAFTVRYEPTGDTELSKHGDASVVTLNLCLGRPGWKGGALRFFESGGQGITLLPRGNESAGAGDVEFSPGMAVIHRGQHKHQALPLLSGERTNVIIWLMGRHGVVRVAPYPTSEQLSVADRWKMPASFSFEL